MLAYKKRQAFINEVDPVKLAYAFPGVNEDEMSSRYPCLVTLIKLEGRGQETFEVFGASTIRQAIELVLRLHTSDNVKSSDVYVSMTGPMNRTDVPLDIPLDDTIETEKVILKRRPAFSIVAMTDTTESRTVHAWLPGGQPYHVSRRVQNLGRDTMTGTGIPFRRAGHIRPVSCSEDADRYRRLLAQPKTIFIPNSLRFIVNRNIAHLKSIAFNQYKKERGYFPSKIPSSGDWLAEHHMEIAAAASRFIKERGRSLNHKFPLRCRLESKRALEIERSEDNAVTLRAFLLYYLELIELFSRSGTILGDAVFYPNLREATGDFILDVVFGRAESLARLFKETDNSEECLWVLRKNL